MTAQEILIEKFHDQTHFRWTTTLSWRKNNKTKIAKQLGTLHSYICIVTFHLGTIDVPREGCDVEAEAGPGEAQVNFADAIENPNPTPEASN